MAMGRKIVIIGNNAAGVTAASYARRTDRTSQITIIDKTKRPAFSRCSLPFVIEGTIASFDDITTFPIPWYQLNKIELLLGATVTRIDPERKVVEANEEGEAGTGTRTRTRIIPYDSLILCTGADPIVVPVPGSSLPEVYPLRSVEDGERILEAVKRSKSAVVVGARFIGLETAAALSRHGVQVSVVEALPSILSGIFDTDMASTVQKSMEGHGIRFYLNAPLEEIRGKEHVTSCVAGGSEIPCEMVIMAAGIRANTALAKAAGIDVCERPAGIKVNDRMETSLKDIYAAGDCVTCPVHAITGRPTLSQLGTVATRQGKVAGVNAAGGERRFPPVIGTCVSTVFDLELAATGLSDSRARAHGIECVSASAEVPGRPHYFPEKVPMRIKLVVRKGDRRLIGAQVIGPKEAGLRVQALSLGITKGVTVDELSIYDNGYCPTVLDTVDGVSVVADLIMRKL